LINNYIKRLGIKRYIQYFIFQRIFRINSKVPWPVHWSSVIKNPEKIKFKYCLDFKNWPGKTIGCYIQANSGIQFGHNIRIGPGVKIISQNHDINDFDKHTPTSPVIIEDNVWLESNSIILPGVELGQHTVVAAGAVVNKSFKEGNCVVGGVPAKVLKTIPDYKSSSNEHRCMASLYDSHLHPVN
jgi:acetyltransferase-like isoleucine patch superfamily enzyme